MAKQKVLVKQNGRKKVIKFKKRKNINIGTLIFLFIAVYIVLFVFYSARKTPMAIYEVPEENLYKDMTVTGVITREEKLYYTPEAGYVNYYFRSGSRVSKNASVYSLDANRSVYDMLGGTGEVSMTEEDIAEVKRMISSFQGKYDPADFSAVYELKENLTIKVGQISDNNLLDRMQDMIDSTGISNGFRFVNADSSGVISYTSDSLDGLTVDMVNSSTFSQEDYTSSPLRSSKQYAAGEAVYKLIGSDDWQIVCPLSMEQYMELKERTSLQFTVKKDDFSFRAPVEFTLRGSDYYMVISMTRYGTNYLEDRFLELEIMLSKEKGLKIPRTALTTKDFYMIPLQYFTVGGDSNDTGLYVVTYSAQTGQPEYRFMPAEIYYQDSDFAYVDKEAFLAQTTIYCADTQETMPLAQISTLEGVYQVNRGYAVFRRIERVEENGDYVVVAKGTSRGISVYDHIALNAENVVDSSIIY
ncbi:MAG: hypothetical protein K2N63_03535 [Lachnospiraceae bacterium]|nr:hypothetical protein [Lachnospiraceae bacterium]